jgi:hypothetical protein
MREQPRGHWQPATKRKWTAPAVRSIALTDDVLRLFGSSAPTADVLDSGSVPQASVDPDGLTSPESR